MASGIGRDIRILQNCGIDKLVFFDLNENALQEALSHAKKKGFKTASGEQGTLMKFSKGAYDDLQIGNVYGNLHLGYIKSADFIRYFDQLW